MPLATRKGRESERAVARASALASETVSTKNFRPLSAWNTPCLASEQLLERRRRPLFRYGPFLRRLLLLLTGSQALMPSRGAFVSVQLPLPPLQRRAGTFRVCCSRAAKGCWRSERAEQAGQDGGLLPSWPGAAQQRCHD